MIKGNVDTTRNNLTNTCDIFVQSFHHSSRNEQQISEVVIGQVVSRGVDIALEHGDTMQGRKLYDKEIR